MIIYFSDRPPFRKGDYICFGADEKVQVSKVYRDSLVKKLLRKIGFKNIIGNAVRVHSEGDE